MNFWERDENAYKNYSQKQNDKGYGAQTQYFNNSDTAQNRYNAENMQAKINEYAGKSQSELMQELLSTANRMKGEGTLNSKDLDDFYSRASVFLNDEQKERMRTLIDMLKGQGV